MSLQIDEKQLLKQFAQDRSDAAFGALVRKYLPLVYNAAQRQTGNETTAEDVSQAVFILLAQKAHTFSDDAYVPAWLFKATRYACSNAMRTENRRRRFETEAARMKELIAVDDADWKELSPVMDEALAKLGSKDRELLLLRYFENLETAELSARMGISEPTARKRLSRAMDRLRSVLNRRGIKASNLTLAGLMAGHLAPGVPEHLISSVASAASSAKPAIATLAGATATSMFIRRLIPVVAAIGLVILGASAWLAIESGIWGKNASSSVDPMPADWQSKLADAFAKTRSVHAVMEESVDKMSVADDVWLEQNPSRCTVIYKRPHWTSVQIADGTNEWNYEQNGSVATRRKQIKNALSQLELNYIFKWWETAGFTRDASRDETKKGTTLYAYSRKHKNGMDVAWIDANFLTHRVVLPYRDYKNDVGFDWNAIVPTDTFSVQPNPQAKIMEPAEYLDSRYPLKSAVWARDFGDRTAALQKLECGADGLIYLIHSSRLTASERLKLGQIPLQFQDAKSRHILPMGDGEGGAWRSIPVSILQVSDVVIYYVVLIPQRPNLSPSHLDLMVVPHYGPGGEKYRFSIDVPQTEVKLESFSAEAHQAATNLVSVIQAGGGQWLHPQNGLNWRPVWAMDEARTASDLADTAERWSNGNWKR